MKLWPGAQLTDLTGKTALITGANSGIGFYAAQGLVQAGARVILACRNAEKAAQAVAQIGPQARFELLDLADFESIHAFAQRLQTQTDKIDILLNNAGVMAPPARQTTRQGFELQFGVNFLGHFLLTSLLWKQICNTPAPRVVQVASVAHRRGRLNWDDLQSEQHYHGRNTYRQSKLAMLVFAQALARKAVQNHWPVCSVAAHPGIAATELVRNGPGPKSLIAFLQKIAAPWIQQSAEAGAWPLLAAATDPLASQGAYYGPQGRLEYRGPPGPAIIEPHAQDTPNEETLWEIATALTGARF